MNEACVALAVMVIRSFGVTVHSSSSNETRIAYIHAVIRTLF